MAFFLDSHRHRFPKGEWRLDSSRVLLANSDDVVTKLVELQSKHVLDEISLTSLLNKNVIATCKRGVGLWSFKPEYFEYRILNQNKRAVAIVNGLARFKVHDRLWRTCLAIRTFDRVVTGTAEHVRGGGILDLAWQRATIEVDWDDGTHYSRSSSIVSVNETPTFYISGPSREGLEHGEAPAYKVKKQGNKILTIYPDGKWHFSPVSVLKRFICDEITIAEFHADISDWPSELQFSLFVSTICAPLILAERVIPWTNS